MTNFAGAIIRKKKCQKNIKISKVVKKRKLLWSEQKYSNNILYT